MQAIEPTCLHHEKYTLPEHEILQSSHPPIIRDVIEKVSGNMQSKVYQFHENFFAIGVKCQQTICCVDSVSRRISGRSQIVMQHVQEANSRREARCNTDSCNRLDMGIPVSNRNRHYWILSLQMAKVSTSIFIAYPPGLLSQPSNSSSIHP